MDRRLFVPHSHYMKRARALFDERDSHYRQLLRVEGEL
jgi:hypothetical protein